MHDASPITASATRLSWKRLARKTKVGYQPSTVELIQVFESEEEARPLGGFDAEEEIRNRRDKDSVSQEPNE
ncbi:hypothetical protein Tsubulata_001847 [Turnera subulata]|uniref:Uncharacterized protein n=1 Tax=Turnera subulata TaxID=218843 RepID=A0A9Q0G3E4_9ROSI|nr:hypothetical protein Tsubulata_001847 [Turnera subulata]